MKSRLDSMVRDQGIDAWKGLLIILVVVGHAIGGAEVILPKEKGEIFQFAWQFIYAFHMSAFFVIVGLLWRHGDDITFRTFVVRKIRRLIVPYFIFGILSIILYQIFAEGVIQSLVPDCSSNRSSSFKFCSLGQMVLSLFHAGGWPNGEGFRMNYVLWFLPCMFIANCLFFFIDKLCRGHAWRFVIIATISAYLGYWIGRLGLTCLPWGISKVFNYLPYIIIGRLIGGGWLNISNVNIVNKHVKASLLLICWIVFGFLIYLSPRMWAMFSSISIYSLYIFLGTVGSLLSYCFSKAIVCWPLILCGRCSLGIMLVHKFVVVALQYKSALFRNLIAEAPIIIAFQLAIFVGFIALFFSIIVTRSIRVVAPWVLGEHSR